MTFIALFKLSKLRGFFGYKCPTLEYSFLVFESSLIKPLYSFIERTTSDLDLDILVKLSKVVFNSKSLSINILMLRYWFLTIQLYLLNYPWKDHRYNREHQKKILTLSKFPFIHIRKKHFLSYEQLIQFVGFVLDRPLL